MTATHEGTMRSSVGDPGAGKRGMNLTLRVWRQQGPTVKGKMVTYKVTDISPDMSFLEMLDVLNEQLIMQGDDPVAFDHDCREGICGMCGVVINGMAHGPQQTTTCQLHMRSFKDGDTIDDSHPAAAEALQGVQEQVQKLLSINGNRTPASFHRELGQLMWDLCGMERTDEGLRKAIDRIREIRQEFWTNVNVSGDWHSFNQTLERAGRVADFLELGELMCIDALHRNESCGGHFRAESQTPEGEALRDDENYAYVAAWEWTPEGAPPVLHREDLQYEYVHLAQRSYK